jgi:glutathione synthase/RimK-type ligase-like ATP-grasp enzyme
MMDDRLLPELAGEPPDSARRGRCRALHEALVRWCDVAPGRVVNRAAAQSSNSSKPYQAQLIAAHGFDVPETLVTNDPEAVHEFRRRHGRVIYKSISGVRSVVRLLDDDDLRRLDRIRWCPVQFQEFVEGENVRVHVVGARVFATRVVSEATDYRYATDQVGRPAELRAHALDDELAARCVALARGLGLPFAGIDLKRAPDGRTVCFEVNPSPGFSYYEANTGQPIAAAVAEYLVRGDDGCEECGQRAARGGARGMPPG